MTDTSLDCESKGNVGVNVNTRYDEVKRQGGDSKRKRGSELGVRSLGGQRSERIEMRGPRIDRINHATEQDQDTQPRATSKTSSTPKNRRCNS